MGESKAIIYMSVFGDGRATGAACIAGSPGFDAWMANEKRAGVRVIKTDIMGLIKNFNESEIDMEAYLSVLEGRIAEHKASLN